MPAHQAGITLGSRGLLRAVGDSLVLYDGSRLLHCARPLDPDGSWVEFGDLAGECVVALTSCPDLNPQHAQLFAVTATSTLLSWTWRGAGSSGQGDVGWYAWQPVAIEGDPVALASWSLGAGHQELVLAYPNGELWAQRRSEWDGWSDQELIGIIRDVVALDALSSRHGPLELYAVTADGELKRKVRDSATAGAGSWGSVDVVAGWADPAVAVVSWSFAGEAEDQAVLLSSRELRQRWRRAGSTQWSDWWSAPAAPLHTEVSALAGWAGGRERQAVAALGGGAHVSVRPWIAQGGWRPWLPAVQVTTQLPTEPLAVDAEHAALPPDRSGDLEADADLTPVPGDGPDEVATERVLEAARAEEATVLFAGRELLPLLSDDPAQIGPFKLQKRIAGGQESTDKFVARDGRGYCFLKVLRPEASDDEVAAFRRESSMARRVVDRHRLANFIDAHQGNDTQRPYLALSYEQGKHLGEVSDGRPLAQPELLVLARSLIEALVELRECQLLHLDVKPSNVIMRNGDYPVVVDFGSAVPAETAEVVEAAFGTVAYAAPEFAGHRAVNPTSDTYSWGAVLVAAANGAAPSRDPRQRSEQIARLPQQLVELVSEALAEEPANRLSLDDAVRRLGRTQSLGNLGLGVHDRLPVERLTLVAGSERPPLSPRLLVEQLGGLATWQYRVGGGVAAMTGIILGFLVGVFIIQLGSS